MNYFTVQTLSIHKKRNGSTRKKWFRSDKEVAAPPEKKHGSAGEEAKQFAGKNRNSSARKEAERLHQRRSRAALTENNASKLDFNVAKEA